MSLDLHGTQRISAPVPGFQLIPRVSRFPVLVIACLALCSELVVAADRPVTVPAELAPFVEPGGRAIAVVTADLDRDGRPDYVLVTEKPSDSTDPADHNFERTLFVITRAANGSLHLAVQNATIVECSTCGQGWGDPFAGVEAGRGEFTVNHYGGGAKRWSTSFTFKYNRRRRSWTLARAEESFFWLDKPDERTTHAYRAPHDFGEIDISQFDFMNYRKR